MITREPFQLLPLKRAGNWISSDRRYARYAKYSLGKLLSTIDEINGQWPKDLGQAVKREEVSQEFWELTRTREFYSDSAIIYSAMAVEGVINFYGVLRFGEKPFTAHFERMALIPKLQMLMLVGEALVIKNEDPILQLLEKISGRRNGLVHPKAKDVSDPKRAKELKWGNYLPATAKLAVEEMDNFFLKFTEIAPDMSFFLEQDDG